MTEIINDGQSKLTIINFDKYIHFYYTSKEFEFYENTRAEFDDIKKTFENYKAAPDKFENYDDFIKYSLDKKPIINNGNNQNEIILKFPFGHTITLTKVNLESLKLEEEIKNLKEFYNENVGKLKKENDKLLSENINLKRQLDEEKKKNDEIVRSYLENRQKYEEGIERNNKIQNLDNKL